MHFHHQLTTLTSKFVIRRNTCTVLSTFHIKQATDSAYYVKEKTVSWIRVNYEYSLMGSRELQNTVSWAHVSYKIQSHGHM
jgi:hypothetical protein